MPAASPSPVTSSRRHTWLLVAGGVLTMACLAAAIASQWGRLPDAEWDFNPAWLGLSIVLMVVFHVANGEIWRSLLAELGGRLDPPRARSIWGTTLLARYVPTGALAVVGRVALVGRAGIARRVALASIIYEQGLALGAALLLGSYFVIVLPQLADEPARFAVLIVAVATLAVLHPPVFVRLSAIPLRRFGRDPLPTVLSTRTVVRYLLLYALTLVIAGLATFAFARSLHSLSIDDLPAGLSSYAVGFAVAVLAFVLPGGLGAREAGIAAALSAAMPVIVALAVAVGMRLVHVLVEVLYVLVVSAIAHVNPRDLGLSPDGGADAPATEPGFERTSR